MLRVLRKVLREYKIDFLGRFWVYVKMESVELQEKYINFVHAFIAEEKKYVEIDEDSYYELYVLWWERNLSVFAPWDVDCDIEYSNLFIEWTRELEIDERLKVELIDRLQLGIRNMRELNELLI